MISVPDAYRWFADGDARGVYREWAAGVADDPLVAARIGELVGVKRQPQLVFATARWLGAPVGSFPEFRDWLLANWPSLGDAVRTRRNQTNEPRRCAVLLPLLAALPQPIALLEVGASAGLCLLPDRYGYAYGDHVLPGPLVFPCDSHGPVPLPTRLPEVVWRAGIDLHPLDVRSAADRDWLRCLVWPGEDERLAHLDAALEIATADPPRVVQGDVVDDLPALAREAPADATLVVVHNAVLIYLDDDRRRAFAATVRSLDARWIAYEGSTVVPSGIAGPVPALRPPRTFFVAAQGVPVATADSYGREVEWL
ncbi:MAG TPA: DUF2332 domain-containing protein [Pseudonocardiaceae bacterium]|nr:DUF2332 domain-containing protein [Pseudonocardiaceae bacterium]